MRECSVSVGVHHPTILELRFNHKSTTVRFLRTQGAGNTRPTRTEQSLGRVQLIQSTWTSILDRRE